MLVLSNQSFYLACQNHHVFDAKASQVITSGNHALQSISIFFTMATIRKEPKFSLYHDRNTTQHTRPKRITKSPSHLQNVVWSKEVFELIENSRSLWGEISYNYQWLLFHFVRIFFVILNCNGPMIGSYTCYKYLNEWE